MKKKFFNPFYSPGKNIYMNLVLKEIIGLFLLFIILGRRPLFYCVR